ncbi:3,4-dihydroxy-2-butanone-4-phosphate synthase [Mucilaginibacter humi]|uniref:3,4-dihydroxy-2-butanone-4-phosphate synthase n=1 Tax=Mucilaginibacter humi TaxID=2732510 RepID=UPI0037446D78
MALVCAPITQQRATELELEPMVSNNTTSYETNFTVSVDLLEGCTTGISATDRSKTIMALIDPATKPEDLGRPGHIFPLIAKNGGVLRRAGHTEATIDLAVLAGLEPAGVICEIMNDKGDMARLPELFELAKTHDLKIVSIKDLIAYRLDTETMIKKEVAVRLPTEWGDFEMIAYTQLNTGENHMALVKGTGSRKSLF